ALPKEKFRPPVVLTELRIFNHAVAISDKAESILHQSISETNELIVPYEKNVLTFEFAALDYALSKQNQYAYQLENFEAKPNIAGKQRTATYTNLDPGTYYFCVKTATPDGVWNPNGIRLKVQILPPYWKTLWFKLLFILLILIVIAILLRVLFKRGELKNALNLEREKARQLHEIDMMKLHFFTNISHEIRTPLTLIIAPLEKLLREKLSPHEQHEHFRLMHRNASQLMRLINQLLDFRKIENGKLKLEISRGDIVAFSRNTFESFADLAHEKAISLHFNAIENEIFTGFDADKYEKILNNLLSNALKYTTKDGSITLNISLALKQNDAETQALAYQKIIEISVIDTGQGISRNDLPKLFTRFLQLGTQKKANSTGIGLSLTKELVELHQGHIYVESEEGKGSRFCVQLPYYPEYKDQSPNDLYNNQTPNENTKPNTTEEEQSQENILLIVEDNTDVRNFLKQQFETQFAIVESTNGQHGLQKALQLIPDLIISDVMMPGLDGFELCRQLKKDERSSHIPLILLSALGTQEHRLEGLQAGADDYITKPFDPSLLQARVDNLLTNRTALREKFSGEMILRPKNITISSPDERFLQKAIEVVEQHITDPDLDIERFAQAVGVSRMQLYRKLKALTDMTVKEFERDIRLERAAQMLQTKGLNISEIAYGVGFKDLSYFRKCFRTKFGKNAREYAEQFNTENKPESH
ncbi:MAG: hypothetical protein RIS47_306, partial [Bacteroidota bacterium]